MQQAAGALLGAVVDGYDGGCYFPPEDTMKISGIFQSPMDGAACQAHCAKEGFDLSGITGEQQICLCGVAPTGYCFFEIYLALLSMDYNTYIAAPLAEEQDLTCDFDFGGNLTMALFEAKPEVPKKVTFELAAELDANVRVPIHSDRIKPLVHFLRMRRRLLCQT